MTSNKSSQPTLRWRLPVIAAALLGLLAAMWAGLIRMGWQFPPIQASLPILHGPLMVCGFLGTVIGLERAVALGGPATPHPLRWPYAGPILTALGSLVLMVGIPDWPGPLLIVVGSLLMVAMFGVIVRRHLAQFTVAMTLGAAMWAIGNLLWLSGWPLYRVVFWWIGFPLLTIIGERLELAGLLRLPQAAKTAFIAVIALFLAGVLLSVLDQEWGTRLAGIGALTQALWLLRYDVARRTIHKTGLTRYIAACLLAGYVWLGLSGIGMVLAGAVFAGPVYDAILHMFFVGFVMSMIFGHAPVIFSALLNVGTAYRPLFYVHLALLHISLILRVVGDLAGWLPTRQWGGLLNVIALLLFLGSTALAVLQLRRRQAAL